MLILKALIFSIALILLFMFVIGHMAQDKDYSDEEKDVWG